MIDFIVPGVPAPQGSYRALVNQHTGKPIITTSKTSGFLRYRADLRAAATEAMKVFAESTGVTILNGGVACYFVFVFPRPEGHWLPANSRRDVPVLRPGAPESMLHAPDVDKLCRSVLDAFTGIVYRDDAQVISLGGVKTYDPDYGASARTLVSVLYEPGSTTKEVQH